MNTKIKTLLLSRSPERGAVLPVLLGLGLIMTVAGLTTVISSQNDEVTATAQQSSAKSLSIAEAGVARVQDLINNLRVLSTEDLGSWKTTYDGLDFASCATSGTVNNAVNDYVDSSGNGKWMNVTGGRFKIVSYTYDSGTSTGTLEIEGEATGTNAETKLEVQIPVDPPGSVPIPGLWANSIPSAGNNEVNANLLLKGCPTSTDGVYTDAYGNSTDDLTGNVTGGDIIADGTMSLPDLPDLPADGVCATPTATEITNGKHDEECYYSIDALTGGEDLPRTNDLPASDNDYHYLVDDDYEKTNAGVTTKYSIYLQASTATVSPTATNKVMLYLKGSIHVQGSGLLDNTYGDTKPTHLQIFGSDGTADYYCSSGSPCTTTSILLGGAGTLEGFILAPKATGGAKGCGGDCVLGSLWINSWDASTGSSTANTVVTQTGDWGDFDFATPWQPINATSSWKREGS
jgi:hypothetical protein